MMIFVKRILVKTTIHTFTSLNGANRWTQERWEESKPPEEKTSKKLLVSSYLSVYYMVVFFWWGAIEINYKIKIYDPDDTGHKEFAKMIIWPVVCFSWLAIDCMYIYLNGLWFSLVHSYSHIHTNLKWNEMCAQRQQTSKEIVPMHQIDVFIPCRLLAQVHTKHQMGLCTSSSEKDRGITSHECDRLYKKKMFNTVKTVFVAC